MAPSSPDHPTVLNALTDENENWSMSVCAQVLNFPSFKSFKTQKDEAVLKWQENEKKIINFLPQPNPWEESQRTLKT